jgi:tRNA A-37 threonylcarbamoyl transferase component Bud32
VVETTLAGRYRLEERVAGGGMGTVFVATDELLRRRVAVKLLREDLVENPAFVERFRREARAVAGLVHPNIATVFDYGEDGGRHFIVMELVEGRDLERVLTTEGRLEPDRARRIAGEVCGALGHAHATGLVHRDVKPANVIITPEDDVKVTDFGIARVADDSTMTAAGSMLGTAQYLSPEQASDQRVGPASDVYSAGIMLFEMLTGEVPFKGGSPVATAMRHVTDEVPPPSSINPRVPPDLDAIVKKATAKEPERRFVDGGDMARALEGRDAGATEVVSAGPPTATLGPLGRGTDEMEATEWPPPGAASPRTPRKLGPALAVVVLLAALAGAAFAAVTLLRDRDAPRRTGGGGAQAPAESPSPPPEEEQLTVPGGLVGSNIAEAQTVLRNAGLIPARDNVEDEAEEGTVVATTPPEGAAVSEGDTVTLRVSTGPPPEPEPTSTTEPSPPEESPEVEETPPGQATKNGEIEDRPA